ncbi:hypothetical protein BJ170DRAFT_35606 [Xylariales sp. AK1849]|nr:hypothetical protein BJ170DRAFT_35606 [Xylariales sp. AK1849]
MGITQSTPTEPSSLPRIETAEQFEQRFRQLLWNLCLSRREQRWMQVVFGKFATSTEGPTYWSESDLIEFLGCTFPEELKSDLTAAGPLIYRCILRLGAFPWHRQPAPTTHGLDINHLTTAIIILLRRPEANISSLQFSATNGALANEIEISQVERDWLHGLLFQCMAAGRDSNEHLDAGSVADDNTTRDDASDAHLLQAHKLVSAYNKQRSSSKPKVMAYGHAVIAASELPSSWSQDFDGLIPKDEFRSLLKILLASELYRYGNGPERLCTQQEQLERGTDNVLHAFCPLEDEQGISWDSFSSALAQSAANLFSSLTRLLAPFVLDRGLDHEQIRSSSKAEAASSLQATFTSSSVSPELARGNILDLPLLAQLATLLPNELALQPTTVVHTVTQQKFELDPVHQHVNSRGRPLVLLARGVCSEIGGHGPQSQEMTFGAFLPQDPTQAASIFQLSPVQSVFSSGVETLETGYASSKLTLQLGAAKSDDAHISLDEHTRIALVCVPRNGRVKNPSYQMQAKFVELVGFAADGATFDLAPDSAFSVPERPNFDDA